MCNTEHYLAFLFTQHDSSNRQWGRKNMGQTETRLSYQLFYALTVAIDTAVVLICVKLILVRVKLKIVSEFKKCEWRQVYFNTILPCLTLWNLKKTSDKYSIILRMYATFMWLLTLQISCIYLQVFEIQNSCREIVLHFTHRHNFLSRQNWWETIPAAYLVKELGTSIRTGHIAFVECGSLPILCHRQAADNSTNSHESADAGDFASYPPTVKSIWSAML